MPLLNNPNAGPPGEFRFTEYRSGLRIKEHTLVDCVSKVIEHRKARGWGPTDHSEVRKEVERQICGRLGLEHCHSEGPDDKWVPVNDLMIGFKLTNIMAASRALLEWIATGVGMESLDEANRRRAICAQCPMNRHAEGCSCSVLYKMIEAAVPKERQFGDMLICGACGCTLKAKVSAPANVIAASERGRGLTYPANCWVPSVIADFK